MYGYNNGSFQILDPLSIFNTMNELFETALLYVGLPLGAYATLLLGAQAVQDLKSEKITSQDHLDRIVDEEAHNLGMNRRAIDAKYFAPGDKGYDQLRGARCKPVIVTVAEKSVEIQTLDIKAGWGAGRGAVRHELYHLQNHFPRPRNSVLGFARAFFYEEPTATLYSLIGKK